MPGKEYGLILPSKKKQSQKLATRTLNPLLNSDDELELNEDDGDSLNWVEASLKNAAGNSGQKSMQKRLLREAYEEDASVFQYDEIYDDMKASQQQDKQKKKDMQQKKPKYIETILKHTEKRKIENERRQERKVQKEREAEGDEFADKESFVTPSYLKKLEELKKAEQDERREKFAEQQTDLHKHKNFGVFYNHLFKQRIGNAEIKQEPSGINEGEDSNIIRKTPSSSIPSFKKTTHKTNYRTQSDLSCDEDHSPLRRVVKKEVDSNGSTDSGDESEVDNRVEYRHRRVEMSPKSGCMSSRLVGHGTNKEKSVRTKEQIIDDKNEKNKTKSRSRSRSRDGSRGKHTKSSTASSSRHRRDRSRSTDRSGRQIERSRKYVRSTSKNREDRNGRHISRTSETKNSIPRDRAERARSGDRSKEREREDHRDNPNVNENDAKKSNGQVDVKEKQSINTTLGSTDINKMNVDDRIQRFAGIFAKKTVGQTFEDAVQRYFMRKAERDANGLL